MTEVNKTTFDYSDIDSMPEELVKVEKDIDKKTGAVKGFKKPAKKKCIVELNGIQFEVVSKVQRALTKLWLDNYETYDEEDGEIEEATFRYCYDPAMLLDLCEKNNIPTEGYTDEGSGVYVDHPTYGLFWGSKKIDVERLDDEMIDKRIRVFVHILNHCCEEEVAKALVALATKKKNGTLHKGRLFTIAHMN